MKPRIPLHPVLLFVLIMVALGIIALLTSCSKQNQVLHKWKIQYWTDTVLNKNAAMECPGDRTWFSDTTVAYNNFKPDLATNNLATLPDHFTYRQWNGMWIRIYFVYKEQID